MYASRGRSAYWNWNSRSTSPPLTRRLVERGVWLRPFGRLVYLMPPYIIAADDLDRLLTAMTASVREELAG